MIISVVHTIGDGYGGMTKTMLERTTMLSKAWHRRGEVLVLSANEPMADVRERLRGEPRLGRRVRVRSPWEELLSLSDRRLRRYEGDRVRPPRDVADTAGPRSDVPIRERFSDSGATLQTDRYRRDGSLCLSHRRDMRERGRPGGSRVTLFDRRGDVVAEWKSATSFYYEWIDGVRAGRAAYVFSDSNFLASMLAEYKRPDVTLIHTLHSKHLADNSSPLGPLARGASKACVVLDQFDLSVSLTDLQHRDLAAAGIATPQTRVIPNPQKEVGAKSAHRAARTAVLVGRLTPDKRVDDAIRAVARTTGLTSLEIYGSGERVDDLRMLVDTLDVSTTVKLCGYDADARRRFAEASFSLLCSRSEGQGLVLLESMAAGCIPIAYDVKYGPADIITDGVDGFLVPDGDVDALARTIDRATDLPPDALDRMRDAARSRAAQFAPDTVIDRWGDALTEAARRRHLPAPPDPCVVLEAVVEHPDDVELRMRVDRLGEHTVESAKFTWIGRGSPLYGRIDTEFLPSEPTPICDAQEHESGEEADQLLVVRVPASRLPPLGPELLDCSVDLRIAGVPIRTRIAVVDDALPQQLGRGHPAPLELYATAHQNLSIRRTRQ
jgi:poly(glycerol-phosphate) alpha-glucosyltransferase